MIRIPISLDFQQVLFSLAEDPWPPNAIEDTDVKKQGNVTILGDKNPFWDFEKDLVKIVRTSCPGEIHRIHFLGEKGIVLKHFDDNGNVRSDQYVQDFPAYYLIPYSGGSCKEDGSLIPNPGIINTIHKFGATRIPSYEINFGITIMPLAQKLQERPCRERFECFRNALIERDLDDFAVYLVKSADFMNLYHDLKQLEELKIPFEAI